MTASTQHTYTHQRPTAGSDSGATINVISEADVCALRLPRAQYQTPFRVQFGKESAVSIVTHYVQGNGLIDKLAIVSDAVCSLISTRAFTDKGLRVVYEADTVIVQDC